MEPRKYITALEFNDFNKNQIKLIGILNHNMTAITTDVNWLKKLFIVNIGIGVGIFVTVVGGFIKLAFF